MSGGSFDYLYAQAHPDPDDVRRMADELQELGFGAAAMATRQLGATLPEDDPLRDVWFAVEWWRSGDKGREDAVKAAEAWAGRREPSEYEKGWLACLNLYAHWKDGVQYVGSTGRTRRDAGVEFLVERGYTRERAVELVD